MRALELAGCSGVALLPWLLLADQRRIERAFASLMGNALEAMPSGGTLAISAAPLT
jgi:signal transduction histidine kinase